MKRRELMYKDGEWSPWDETKTRQREATLTLKRAIKKYLRQAKRELASSTIKSREEQLNVLKKRFGDPVIIKLTEEQLEQWVNARHLKYKSKMKRLEVVNALYTFIEDKGWAEKPDIEVFAKRAEKKRAKQPDKTWIRTEEFGKVKQAAADIHQERMKRNRAGAASNTKYRTFEREFDYIFDFLINTALRRSDLLNLSTDWFIRGYKMLKIGDDTYQPKSQSASEIIPLTPEAREIGRRWVGKYGKGVRPFKDITNDWITHFFKDVFRKALPEKAEQLSLHKMRDSAAMYLLFEKGYSPQTVQQVTRHEDLSTLNIYIHWAPSEGLKEIENKG